ncbi:MAG TPA: M24 family metallopeptidase [Longimicrobiales bacterium]|nr:M24 family metallopeptidase [Longimicrobiales bacterium]
MTPTRALGLVALLLVAVGCDSSPNAGDAETGTTLRSGETAAVPFPDDPDLWPSVREERIQTLLGPAMARAGVDSWVVFARENANDPIAAHIGAENAGGLAAFLFFVESDGSLSSIAISPSSESTALAEVSPLDSVMPIPRGFNAYTAAADILRERDPATIAVNSSSRNVADGLSWTQRNAFEDALGPDLAPRLVSSGDLVVEWLSVKLPREVDIMRRAAEITEQLELEAYEQIVPGETTDAEVARFLKGRMAELGVTDGWAPDQNPNVNSGPDRGHSHSTDKVIMPGDVIQTDFGIKVHDVWVTDIQRFAYVLRDGEIGAPPIMQERWELAKAGNRAAFEAMRPGATGWDVDRAQRSMLETNGSISIPWSTGHPVGYWAHDLGPRLGGSNGGRPATGDAARELVEGQTFAFDGFFGWEREDGTTKTISVEEMVVITEDGAEWLIAPQEEWVLIGG